MTGYTVSFHFFRQHEERSKNIHEWTELPNYKFCWERKNPESCNLMPFENYIQSGLETEKETARREKKMQPNISEGIQLFSYLRNPDSDRW